MTPTYPPDSGDWANCDSTKQDRETEIRESSNDFVFCRCVYVYVYKYKGSEERTWGKPALKR